MIKNYSILRNEEYRCLSALKLEGKILDVGGSKKSGYHDLVKGSHAYTVINIDATCEPDFFVDIEKKFPFDNDSFDHSVCLNVLEHVFEFENVFAEQLRCVKKGGRLVFAVPFMHFIHGSPDDYVRFTASSYRRLAEKYDAEVSEIYPLGFGLFSLIFQLTGGTVPTNFLRQVLKSIAISLDKGLNKLSKKYKKLSDRIPLGYFIIFIKV